MKAAEITKQLFILVMLAVNAGCVSSPETKQASTQYKAALDAYTQNVAAFERAWVAEIDALVNDLEAALAARAVVDRIRKLSADYNGFSGTEWENEIARNGLITLSEAAYSERERVRNFVGLLANVRLINSADPEEVIGGVFASLREDAERALSAAESIEGFDEAELARLHVEAEQGPFGGDAVANAIVKIIITARMSREAVPRDLKNLETVIAALRTAHASVDRWIQTDVTIPGEGIAELAQAWSDTLGGLE